MRLNDNYSSYIAYFWKKDGLVYRSEFRYLSFDSFGKSDNFDFVLFLKFDLPFHVNDHNDVNLRSDLELLLDDEPQLFILLTNYQEPPSYMLSSDEFIYSFSCGYNNFIELLTQCNLNWSDSSTFLFILLDQMFKAESALNRVVVRQLPILNLMNCYSIKCDVIIPHKGSNHFLEQMLFFLKHIENLNVYIGLDQDITEEIINIRRRFSSAFFYNFSPNPVGPYVIRNRLIEESSSNLLFFQDSDDIPCADRFNRLSQHMQDYDCELCGSHEIQMDYYTKSIRAIRYPANVTSSLKNGPGHSLLHPSSGITRDAFYLCDRLSEERIFGNDTKFLYHSYFSLNNIQNVDEFLYIRRLHPNSLTHTAQTGLTSPARIALLERLIADFNMVKSGRLDLQSSSLGYIGPRFPYKAVRF
jgi:hypothetical protein